MKTYSRFKTDYTIKQKGQSLVELASFGAILLFCLGMLVQYGMSANYQQNLQMQAFRKAMRAAYYKTGPAATVSITMLNDKPMPNPTDPWGVPDRRPIGGSGSATWDTNLQALYIEDYSQTPDPDDLPRSIIEINNINTNPNRLGLDETDLSDGAIDNIDSTKGAFTTAGYGNETPCRGNLIIILENSESQRIAQNEEYRRVPRNCNMIMVKNTSGIQEAYVKIGLLQQKVSSADVDGDGEIENIIAVEGDQPCDSEGYCGRLLEFRYVDFQQGDINTECTMIYPWETEKLTKCFNARQQGLISNYRVVKMAGNGLFSQSMVKTESPTQISTTTNLDVSQEVSHTIRKRDGTEQFYRTTFRPEDTSFTWNVTK